MSSVGLAEERSIFGQFPSTCFSYIPSYRDFHSELYSISSTGIRSAPIVIVCLDIIPITPHLTEGDKCYDSVFVNMEVDPV